MVYSPKPRSDVFCFKLNFKISKLGYCMFAHVTVRAGAPVSKKVNSRETEGFIKTTRGHSSLPKNKTHFLLLAIFLVDQARLEHSNLHVLQCMIRLVKMRRYRKVIFAVYYIPAVLSKTVRHSEIIFSHGSSNARGVAVLIKSGLDIVIRHELLNPNGRSIILKVKRKDKNYLLIFMVQTKMQRQFDFIKSCRQHFEEWIRPVKKIFDRVISKSK